MPTNTYNPIFTQTLASPSASIEIGTVPSTYKHLRLILNQRGTDGTAGRTALRFNGDTASNYHYVQWGSTNTSTTSDQSLSVNYAMVGYNADDNMLNRVDIFGYNTTQFNKTIMSVHGDNYPEVGQIASTWRNTNAITSISVICLGVFPTGTNVTLYGLAG
jgi:hypothetical protein